MSPSRNSHFSDVSYGYHDAENDQHNGYGLRASIKASKRDKRINYGIETFIRYWNIKDSDVVVVYEDVDTIYLAYEPKNTSREIGLMFTVRY